MPTKLKEMLAAAGTEVPRVAAAEAQAPIGGCKEPAAAGLETGPA